MNKMLESQGFQQGSEWISDEGLRLSDEEYQAAEQRMWDEVHAGDTAWVMGEDGFEHPVWVPRTNAK